jgi:hypothetical protein
MAACGTKVRRAGGVGSDALSSQRERLVQIQPRASKKFLIVTRRWFFRCYKAPPAPANATKPTLFLASNPNARKPEIYLVRVQRCLSREAKSAR